MTLSKINYPSLGRLYSSATIYALATRQGTSAIGVIRVSGPQSQLVLRKLTRGGSLQHRITSVRKLFHPDSDRLLDEALTVLFKAPRSYTGEDVLELHVHGGRAITKAVIQAIASLHSPEEGINIRYAENGEFSKRAFLNGKFDLTEVEGINAVIHADTEAERLAALQSVKGETKEVFNLWRAKLVKNIALLAAVIDFGEDHDIREVQELFNQVDENLKKLDLEIRGYLQKVKSSQILVSGIKMILLGPPNAGKSSLLNSFGNEQTAIVSEIAGTTRDIVNASLDINGYKVLIGDTAGIRIFSKVGEVEKQGIQRALDKSFTSDLALIVILSIEDLPKEVTEHVKLLQNEGKPLIFILNKSDLVSKSECIRLCENYGSLFQLPVLPVSCIEETGLDVLKEEMVNQFKIISETEASDPVTVSSRIQDLLMSDVLYGFKEFFIQRECDDIVLASEALRQSLEGMGKITGQAVGVEEILGVVFSSFCIGK